MFGERLGIEIMKISAINNIYNFSTKSPTATTFSGYDGEEIVSEDIFVSPTQRKKLTQITSFFRDPDSFEFVKRYFRYSAKKDNVKCVVGACSTGEEAWTLKMILGDKADVLGFDLGSKVIERAQSGKFDIAKVAERDALFYDFLSCLDRYLAFEEPANAQEIRYKELFREYFKPTGVKKRTSSRHEDGYIHFIAKEFRVKESKENECRFMQGDVLKLDEFIEPNSVDVFTFRNALYHLTHRTNSSGEPRPAEEITPVLDELFGKINKALAKDGLFVLGKHSTDHEKSSRGVGDIVYDLLEKNRFKPVFVEYGKRASVWKKVGD